MNISVTDRNGVTVLTLQGERLDAHNSEALKGAFRDIFEAGKRNVLVELGNVRFIDSSGLGALVSGLKNALSTHGRMALSGLQDQVYMMFELTRLHRVFDIYSGADEALASFAGK